MTTAIVEYSKTEAALADLTQRFKDVVYNVTTREGMEEARDGRAELRGYYVDLEKVRVEIKAPALERCRLIDADAKSLDGRLRALYDPIDAQIKNEEKRKEREAMEKVMTEQRRVDAIRANIEMIRALPASCVGKTSNQVAQVLEMMQLREIGSDYAELRVEAEEALRSALAQVSVMLSGAQAQEAEAERVLAERQELAKLRAEQAERDRASRAEIERAEQESRARIAEEDRQARAERAKEEAVAQAARKVEEDETRKERLAQQAREDVERQKRAAEDARLQAERERQAAEQREIDRKAGEIMDAHGMLAVFKKRFGHIAEFAPVVSAIDSLKKRKAA